MAEGQSVAEMRAEIARQQAANKLALARRLAAENSSAASSKQSLSATTKVSYKAMEQVGLFSRVQVDMEDPFSIRINKTFQREELAKMERAVAMAGSTKKKYEIYVKRCLVLAYRSMFHGSYSTKLGWMRNTPLMYKGVVGIGYGSGSLYDSINVTNATTESGFVSRYGEVTQTLKFVGPRYNAYGKILGTGKRKAAPIKLAPLMSWIRVKIARGEWQGEDKPKNYKGLSSLAMAISQSYSGKTKEGVYSSVPKKREQSMPDWYMWEGNEKVQTMFRRFHSRGVTKYYQMLLNDIKAKYKERYGN